MQLPIIECPNCKAREEADAVLTAQSNQNVIYRCGVCGYKVRNIKTSKG